MGDDVDLIEDDGRVEDVERGVVDRTSKNYVLQELETVCVVYLPLDRLVADGNRLVEM